MKTKIDHSLAISIKEGEILADLVKKRDPRRVVEVGTGHGYSTSWMLRNLSGNSILNTLDIKMRKIPYKIPHNMIFLNGKLSDYIYYFDKNKIKIDFLFLDSDHQIHNIVKDVEMILPHLTKKALVAVHDTIYCEEMGKCLSDYFNRLDSERLKTVGVRPSEEKWIYKNHDTEYGLGVAIRGGDK